VLAQHIQERTIIVDYKDRSPFLIAIGVILLLIGAVAAFLGPVELHVFYLFSEGGRFHYAGFGFGSFMFANIAAQVAGYYLVAILCITLGYGHLKVRRWARPLALTLLWSWLVVGAPLSVVLFLMLVTAKALTLAGALATVVLLGLSYLVIPGLLIRFYSSRNVRLTFENKDPRSYWLESLPIPIHVLSFLYLFYIAMLHAPILLNGIFPVFGTWITGLQGVLLLDAAILCLALLTWGTLRQWMWAWWGALIYFGLLTFSSVMTLSMSSYADLLFVMSFPPAELEFLAGVPLQGFHFAVFIAIPLLITLGVIVASRPHFGASGRAQGS
jgi:hypothetical protein